MAMFAPGTEIDTSSPPLALWRCRVCGTAHITAPAPLVRCDRCRSSAALVGDELDLTAALRRLAGRE